ncbi:DNA polymerase I [bacterium]|jgi:DNA polymerase-1|nr:DNA polymerase I [bacterium]MBT6018229.1 DNA polymerase I [bacterium]
MTEIKKKLFIVDGYAILYRAHYALIRNPLITSYGFHTSALFGFSNHIIKLINDENPDYLVCAFDSKEKTFRHKMYSSYKANRPEMPLELQQQIPHLWEVLEAMNIPVLRKPGFEADDIIGTITNSVSDSQIESYIVSGDKDFMQLINDKVFLYAPGKRNYPPVIYDRQGVIKKWGLPPEKIIDLLALMGDSSDNVPGVSGVGVKTAVKLLKEYDNIESVLDNASKIKNKRVYDGLTNGRDSAYLSKELVTIVKDVDVDTSIEKFITNSFNLEDLSKKFKELEFHGLLKYVSVDDVDIKTKKIEKVYKTILNIDELKELVKKVQSSDMVSIDLETTSVNPMVAEIVGVSISFKKNEGFYVPILYLEKNKNNFGTDDLKIVLENIKGFLENDKIKKVGQNIKYDTLIFSRNGINVTGIYFDTMVAASILNPSARSYKLDMLSVEFLNYTMVPIEDLIGRGKDQITMDMVPIEKAAYYAAEDADIVLQLSQIFISKLEENKQMDFFIDIEMPLITVLTKMELEGVFVDQESLNAMSVKIGDRLDILVKEIYKISDTEFNVNSTQQLAKILFDDLKLTQIKKRSTAENVLKELIQEHELPTLILEYRKLNKLKNTYVDALPTVINPDTNRIHSTFNQTIASTGRLSSTNPNFQNIPIRTKEGREIRKSFITQRENWEILSADYSQIELRVMAHLSEDLELCNAFNANLDIHTRTASLIYNVSIDDVQPDMRRTAKVINFGIMYGAGPFRISQELGISRKASQEIIKEYFNQYSGVKQYISATLDKARDDNYVETLLGRRRSVWDINSQNALKRQAAERIAINMPIQGSAAELIKIAMIDVQKNIELEHMSSKLILQIHDELLFEFPVEEKDVLIPLVKKSMENAMKLKVPIIVDYGSGKDWFEAH